LWGRRAAPDSFSVIKKIIFSLLFTQSVFAQRANYFVKYFGSGSYTGKAVYQLSSGSIYAAGSANVNVIGGTDIFLAKFDADGNWLWTEYYGTPDEDVCNSMVFNGSSFIICGQTSDASASNVDGLMLAVDTSGNQQWLYPYGIPELNESLSGLSNAINGGIIASGFKSDSLGFGHNFWLIKTNSEGVVQWEKVYGDSGINEVSDAALQLADGDILLSGDKQVGPSTYNAWLIKTDSAGNYKWDLVFANPRNGGCKNLMVDSLNNILVIGEAATDSSSNFDIQVCKADMNGNLIWLKYVRASNESDAGFDLTDVGSANYMLTGYYYDTLTNRKLIQMMLLDSAGNEINRKLFGNSSINIGYQIIRSVYGGYIICGSDFQNGALVLIYDDVETLNGIDSPSPGDFIIYPNPAHYNFIILLPEESGNGNRELEIYDAKGRVVQKQSLHYKPEAISCKLNSGLYLIKLESGNAVHTQKLFIE
jgi:hypothetical protein